MWQFHSAVIDAHESMIMGPTCSKYLKGLNHFDCLSGWAAQGIALFQDRNSLILNIFTGRCRTISGFVLI